MNVHEIDFDISKRPSATSVLYLGQDDMNGTTLKASIYDDGVPFDLFGYAVKFCMRLPDDTHYYSVSGTVSGNVATFPIDEAYAATVSGGSDVCYVEVRDGNTLIASTSRIRVVVLQGARSGAAAGETHASEIDEAVEEVRAVVEEAEEAEALRVQAEQARDTAENVRASAETSRATNERARASAETARASAESSRASAENSRASAESSRASAETTRASAESSRVSEFATLKQNAITATAARANAAAGLAEEARDALTDQASYYTYETIGDDELLTLVTID